MKIIILSDTLSCGGKERQLSEIACYFVNSGYISKENIKVISLDVSKHYDSVLENNGISVHHLIRKFKWDPFIILSLRKIISSFNPNIIMSFNLMSSFYSILSSINKNIYIFDCSIRDSFKINSFKNYIISRFVFKKVFGIISNSNAGIVVKNAPKNKSFVVYNGFNFKRIDNLISKESLKKNLNIKNKYVIGMVASFNSNKDWDTFFKSTQILSNIRSDISFVAIGDGPDIKRYKNKYENNSNYVFTGQKYDIESIENIFDIGVLCSYSEGIPNSIMEFMALGKPIIVTAGGGTKELVIDGVNGFIIPNKSPNILVEKILILLNENNLACEMGQSGNERIKKYFSIEKAFDNYKNIFNKLNIPIINKKVIFIGVGYFPYYLTGDKNYWLKLISKLSKDLDYIYIFSLNDCKDNILRQYTERNNIEIFNFNRPFHLFKNISNKKVNYYRHQHKQPFEFIERTLSFIKMFKSMKRIINNNDVNNIHLMDNFGPIVILLKLYYPKIFISVSSVTISKKGIIYKYYIKLSYKFIDKVIAYSEATRKRVINFGLNEKKVKLIRWGTIIDESNKKTIINNNDKIFKYFNLDKINIVFLWSGFIQQVGKKELLYTINICSELTKIYDNILFVFAIKPEFFENKYLKYNTNKLKILSTNNDLFNSILNITNIFISPILNNNSTIAPPLTWIEVMNKGIPIITTNIEGADELIDNNKNGFIVENKYYLKNKIIEIIENKICLNDYYYNSKAKIKNEYNIDIIKKDYLNMWNQEKEN